MDSETVKKKAVVHAAAQFDPVYRERMNVLRREELRLDGYEMEMTGPQRNAMWDFFDALEDVNDRLMELACQVLELPKESQR
ncbi:MAG: hypothetical protein ACI4PO_12030 [Faecousia sp.]